MNSVAARIREVMKTKGWAAREFSRAAGLAEGTVGILLKRLEDGSGSVVLDTLNALADAGGVDRAWLSHGTVPPGADCDDERATTLAAARKRHVDALKWIDELAAAAGIPPSGRRRAS